MSSLSEPFVRRPVATTLLTCGVALAGLVAYFQLPVSPLPQLDIPTISVSANMAGASPETMASSVATPLERHLGAIADVTEMTSESSVGRTQITLQFGAHRNLDGAARDVQAAINASRADLPAALRANPTYRKQNPADTPILILALTSSTLTQAKLYDAASTVLQQRISQIDGVGDVSLGGSSLPAVRVEMNPSALFKYGIGMEDVRAALSAANANSPKGTVESATQHWQIYSNDQAREASQYENLVVAFRNGAPVRLRDVATVMDSVEDIRNVGVSKDKPAVIVVISREPGANIIQTVDRIRGMLPELQASLPGGCQVDVAMDRSITIRASLHDVETTLAISISLVILVVFAFLRDARATLIPCVAVPISLIGTLAAMYLLGYSLDNLSLMALTIATGFVVDDAIVVMENVVRHVEGGMAPFAATLLGTREVGFTVLSMSLSLIAVFIPMLLMGDVVGMLFREFTMTLSVAILISMVISLTTTPMMCARLLGHREGRRHGRLYRWSEGVFQDLLDGYEQTLRWALRHWILMLGLLALTIVANVYLFANIQKGFFPEQDTGLLMGFLSADQSSSFQRTSAKLKNFIHIVQQDRSVADAVGMMGGSSSNARVFVSLKPLKERKESAEAVIGRLRPQLTAVAGANLALFPAQDFRLGGRGGGSSYQYTLQADELSELREWTPKLVEALKSEPLLEDVDSDQRDKSLETDLVIDRASASRLGLTASQIDNALQDAFAQRTVSTIYRSLNQYHVVMVVATKYWQDPSSLRDIYVSTSGGAISGTQSTNAVAGTTGGGNAASVASDAARNARMNAIGSTGKGSASSGQAVSTRHETMVPLSAFAHYELGTTPQEVSHTGQFASSTVSFSLAEGASLGDAVAAVNRQINRIHMPTSVHGSFQGNAGGFQKAMKNEGLLIIAAIVAIYLVLGVLYESYAHPITILSTLPSAGVGAVSALMLFDKEFSLIALIGVILLIGIVKKNAIMMIDFAIEAERSDGLSPRDAIFKASLLRFRPIMMTTLAAMLGAVPLALGQGDGAEIRQPLGVSIVGGLLVSQLLTLYTTPVVYLLVDRARRLAQSLFRRRPATDTGRSDALHPSSA